jgi:hypothetical protein
MQTFQEMLNIAKRMDDHKQKSVTKMGQQLAADIVKEVKRLNPTQNEARKELNKQRINALGLKVIQGGKA